MESTLTVMIGQSGLPSHVSVIDGPPWDEYGRTLLPGNSRMITYQG